MRQFLASGLRLWYWPGRLGARLCAWLAGSYVQLLLGTVVVAVGPAAARWQERVLTLPGEGWLEASIVGSGIAFLVGIMVVRQFLRFPHTHGPLYVVPIFLATFGLLFAVLVMGRIEVSRYQIFSSFVLSILWSLAYVHVAARSRRMKLAVVPFGTVDHEGWSSALVQAAALRSPQDSLAGFDAVVADLRADLPQEWERFLADCALSRVPVYHVKQMSEWLTGRVHIEHLSENQFGALLVPRSYEVAKRIIDLGLVIASAPIVLPLMAMIAIVVRVESPGPVLFMQTRLGYRGRPFRMIKFRTMHEGREGPGYTVPDDLRVTRAGRILRQHRLDELPQIANILAGQMSWIGPRPESLQLAQWYERDVPFHSYRHIVRPGITGWAQINQGQTAGPSEAAEKLQYDFFYIKHFSIWLDLLIVMRTVRVVLTGRGSR